MVDSEWMEGTEGGFFISEGRTSADRFTKTFTYGLEIVYVAGLRRLETVLCQSICTVCVYLCFSFSFFFLCVCMFVCMYTYIDFLYVCIFKAVCVCVHVLVCMYS
jgi:hypothetical protein